MGLHGSIKNEFLGPTRHTDTAAATLITSAQWEQDTWRNVLASGAAAAAPAAAAAATPVVHSKYFPRTAVDVDIEAEAQRKRAERDQEYADQRAPAAAAAGGGPGANAPGAFVVVEDYLIRFRAGCAAMQVDQLLTLKQLFRTMWEPVRTQLCNKNVPCLTYVLVCDDSSNTPPYKEEERAQRRVAESKSDAKKGFKEEAQPYPPTFKLLNNGVVLGESDASMAAAAATAAPEEEEAQGICLRRLRATRGGLQALWRAFYPMIEDAMKRQSCPSGRTFISDHDANAPTSFLMRGDGVVDSGESAGDVHSLGEADPALVWWCHRLQVRCHNVDVRVYSTDTDFLALWYLYRARQPRTTSRRVWFISEQGALSSRLKTYAVASDPVPGRDVRDMDACLASVMRYSGFIYPAHLGWWCILMCDNDFLPSKARKELFPSFKLNTALIAAMQVMCREDAEVVDWAYTGALTLKQARAFLETFVRRVWHARIDSTQTSLAALRRDLKHGASVPSDEVIDRWAERVGFTINYWSSACEGRSWRSAVPM